MERLPDKSTEAPDDPDAERVGSLAEFPFDRMTVERFRSAFPRARWSDKRRAWFVPGKTASKRIGSWLARIEAEADAYADAKGRDAFDFEPIESRYLDVGEAGFLVRTPYSRTVVEELQQVPYARWDGDLRIWHVPFRSVENLRRRWPTIEAAAARNEPEQKKARQLAEKGSIKATEASRRAAERKRRRYPVPSEDLPPFERPLFTAMGVVIFTAVTGEVVDPEAREALYPAVRDTDLIWASWRKGRLDELVTAWPARTPPNSDEIARGWWYPTLEELRPARREAKARTRRAKKEIPGAA